MPLSGMPFPNLSANLRQLARSPATWTWVGIVLAIQALIFLMGGPTKPVTHQIFRGLGLTRDGLLDGKVWQLVTYAFLHGGWWHAGLNSLWILLIGSRVENISGAAAMSRCMVLGILGGGLGHVLLAPGGTDAAILVGMSGGCVALLLLLTTLSPESRMAPIPVSGKSLGMGILVAALLLALIHPDLGVPGFSAIGKMLVRQGMGSWFQMGHACHFGGGLVGCLYGRWLLRPRVSLKRLRQQREQREARASRRAEF